MRRLAVTGSVDQHGRVQAIGGVNEKIEGFFRVCKEAGLTGKQGVMIPESNVRHLVLRPDVVQAVQDEGVDAVGAPAPQRLDHRLPRPDPARVEADEPVSRVDRPHVAERLDQRHAVGQLAQFLRDPIRLGVDHTRIDHQD